MPTTPNLYADDLMKNLKKKHEAGSYKEMVRVPLLLDILLYVFLHDFLEL